MLDNYYPVFILAIGAGVYLCLQRLSLQLDPGEPPLLKPSIPYIGHIIGIFWWHAEYYNIISDKYRFSICTIPLLTARTYVITSPALIQSAFRSKNLSFEPFMTELAQGMLGMSDEAMKYITNPGTATTPSFLSQFIRGIHDAMTPENLQKMNTEALKEVASTLNALGESFEPESFYLWLRSFLTVATCNALLGKKNPIEKDRSLVNSLWDFEGSILALLLGIIPSFFVPEALKGRAAIQQALINYYTSNHDLEPGVAEITKVRAATYRNNGLSPTDIGRFELAHLHVSTANVIPTLFWNLVFVLHDSDVTAACRDELLTIITEDKERVGGRRMFKMDITKFDSNCPLFVSAYKETIRLVNSQLGTRRVMADTKISDGENTYLMRKGADCVMPAGVTHLDPFIWGKDARVFNARRFLQLDRRIKLSEKEKEDEKARKGGYFPFGGGKHLCPGRNFAFAEILGTVGILLLGFDIRGEDGALIQVPYLGRAILGEGVVKPVGKGVTMGAKLRRRKGWEDVLWEYVVKKA